MKEIYNSKGTNYEETGYVQICSGDKTHDRGAYDAQIMR